MAKYEIDLTVLPGLGAQGHVDRELGRCKPGEEIEATAAQAKARPWLKAVKPEGSTKKSTSTKAAKESKAANAKEAKDHPAAGASGRRGGETDLPQLLT